MSRYYRSILNVQGGAIDPDAQAFLDAAKPFFSGTYFTDIGLSEAVFDKAISDFYVKLKVDGIYNKLVAFYPIVGATAGAHKFNGKNPIDSNAAYRKTYFGGITHSIGGEQGNGMNGYAVTHLANNVLNRDNNSFGFYSRTNRAGANRAFGVQGLYSAPFSLIYPKFTDGNTYATNNASGVGTYGILPGSSDGLIINNRINSTTNDLFKDASKNTASSTSLAPNPFNYYTHATNNGGTAIQFDNIQIAFEYYGEGLTDTEITNFRTAIVELQTTLSRNV